MNNFKRACSIAGVTGSAKASLEECIDGLKQLIRTDDDEDGLEVCNLTESKDIKGAMSRLVNPIQTGLFWSICDWGGAPRTPPLYLWNQ